MMLKKCVSCEDYNLTDKCKKCGAETKSAHYKFVRLRDELRDFVNVRRK